MFFTLRNSTVRYEQLSRTKFVIKAVIYLQDRDKFELTKNMTPAQFKRGNQFDDEWYDRISRYVDHVVKSTRKTSRTSLNYYLKLV